MAGEVKYDGLPFIDSTGKDTYEAGGDLFEPSYESAELKSESVDHLHISHHNAFNSFQNKYLDSTNIDFSDKIISSRKAGYESKSIYEIIGEQVVKETLQQKYQRLQLELQELSEDVQKIKNDKSIKNNENSPVLLSQQVKNLQKELEDLHLEKILGPDGTSTDSYRSGTWKSQIIEQLQSIRGAPSTKEDGGNASNGVVYEIRYRPEHAKFAQAGKISELEAKLKDIESFVGQDRHKFQSLLADREGSSDSLMDATECLQAKLSLFDIAHIDMIATRLQGLLHCINEISQKKETIECIDQKAKINELHGLISSWESVMSIVPNIIERLKALHSINDHAGAFSQSLEHLTSTQTEVRNQLRVQKDTLKKYEKSFEDNIKAIQSNCTSLEERIKEIMTKVA